MKLTYRGSVVAILMQVTLPSVLAILENEYDVEHSGTHFVLVLTAFEIPAFVWSTSFYVLFCTVSSC